MFRYIIIIIYEVPTLIADENVVKSESLLTHVQNPETVFTFFTQFYPIEPSYWTHSNLSKVRYIVSFEKTKISSQNGCKRRHKWAHGSSFRP